MDNKAIIAELHEKIKGLEKEIERIEGMKEAAFNRIDKLSEEKSNAA